MSDAVLDLLRQADPVGDLDHLPAPTDPAVAAVFDAIVAGEITAPDLAPPGASVVPGQVVDLAARRARRRRRAAVVAAVVAVAAAAFALVVTQRPADPVGLACYAAATTDSDRVGLFRTGDNPVDPCRELWEQGEIDPTVTTPEQVPPLVACVLPDGPVGVFPTGSCADVVTGQAGPAVPLDATSVVDPTDQLGPTDVIPGLPVPDFEAEDARARAALDQIRLAMLDVDCVTYDQAEAIAEQAFDDHGVDGWTIEPLGEITPEACVEFFPQGPEQRVSFVDVVPD